MIPRHNSVEASAAAHKAQAQAAIDTVDAAMEERSTVDELEPKGQNQDCLSN